LLAALLIFFRIRFGWLRTLFLSAVALPILFVVLGGRQTSFSASENTGQSRIQLWSDGLENLKQNPLFGIGKDKYSDYSGHVAHNSFLHAFTELGLFGACSSWAHSSPR